jgi:DNA-binding NarL/FixJ family response regulator
MLVFTMAAADSQAARPSIRAVLAEDSYLASEGIARVIDRIEDVELVATSADLDSLRVAIDEHAPDIVLTDIRMPPTNTDEGIRLAKELEQDGRGIGVIVLSQHSEPAYATALLEDGSRGRAYLLKERIKDAAMLAEVLRSVAAGGSYVDPLVVETLVRSLRTREQSQLDDLTPRELEILALIAEGRSNAAIAEKLVLTKRAVERHINGIFMKLDLGNAEDISRRVKAALIFLAGHAG